MSKDIDISDLPPPDEIDVSDLPPPDILEPQVSKPMYGPEVAPAKEPSAMDALSAALGHAARGATFGYGDKIAAGLESAVTSKTYDEALKEQLAKQQAREQAFPTLSQGAEIGGLVASPVNKIMGMLAGPFNAASKLPQLEKLKGLIDVMKTGAVGTATGALTGAGYGTGVGQNALIGGLLGPAAKLAPKTTMGLAAGLTLGPMVGDEDSTMETIGLTGLGLASDLVGGTKFGKNIGKSMLYKTGEIMEYPQRAMETVSEGLGKAIRYVTPKELAVEEPLNRLFKVNSSSPGGSKLVQQLKQVINTSELGNKVHSYEQALKKAGDVAFKNIGNLNDAEKATMYDAIQEAFFARGRNSYKPDVSQIAKDFEAYAEANPYVKNMPVSEYLKVKVKNDVETSLRAFGNSMKLHNTPETVDAQIQTLWDNAIGTLGDIDKNVYNSNLQVFSKYGDTKKATFGDVEMNLSPWEKTTYNKPQQTTMSETSISQTGGKPDYLKNPMSAQNKLEDIVVGKRAINMMGMGLGAYNYDRPFWAGVGAVPLAADFVGAAGRAVQRKASSINSTEIAKSWVSNPSLLKMISQSDSSLGKLAQSTLNDLQNHGQEGIKTKLFLFSMNPEFRKLVLGDTTNQDRQSQESTSSSDSAVLP